MNVHVILDIDALLAIAAGDVAEVEIDDGSIIAVSVDPDAVDELIEEFGLEPFAEWSPIH